MIEDKTNNIAVPNDDMDVLKNNFGHCFDKDGAFDFDKFKRELETKKVDFSKESYSMDWLGKKYARLLATDPALTLLREDKVWNERVENKDSQNLLLKGDNLEVLKHLSNAYHEKVKMIYIDPPYNTGGDGFVYEDDRKFTAYELSQLAGVDGEQAKKILKFVNSKSNSHSAWLTFMYPRLYIAKQLLRDDGVIFVSIDDNEVAQLRLMMDEIFGEENFINKIIWKKNSSGKTVSEKYPENIDYLYMFGKQNYKLNNVYKPLAESSIKMYSKNDNDNRGLYATFSLQKTSDPGPETTYDYIDNEGKLWKCPNKGWRLIKSKIKALENDNRLYFEGNTLREKNYWNERENEGKISDTLWDDVSENNVGTSEVDKLLGKSIFSNPKPIDLIMKCINTIVEKEDIILDFFAGSGTTGDAVMQLNSEDNGNRKYILVQLPEIIDKVKSKTAYDFVKNELKVDEPTIFEITKERLIRAAKKINDSKDLLSEGDKQDLGFKVFETMPIWEDYELVADVHNPDQALFNHSSLTSEDIFALLTTWKTSDGIELTQELEAINLGGYTAYYGNKKLYLMHSGFTTKNLIKLINLIDDVDDDTNFNPASIIAFGHNFTSIGLREIAEGLANYTNKKKLEIDFVTRI